MEAVKKSEVAQAMVAYKSMAGDQCCVTATEWDNAEGFDVTVDDRIAVQLSNDDFKAVCVAVNLLELDLESGRVER